MRNLIFSFLVLALASPSFAESPASCDSLDRLDWLIGHWAADDGSSSETWTAVSDQTFEGVGVAGRSEESLRLAEMSGQVFYWAKVAHNALPTPFRATACSADRAVFENPDHDFPKQLEYRRDGETLIVTVSDGAERGFQLRWTRRTE